jgi:linoleoyl-CoA desaturase
VIFCGHFPEGVAVFPEDQLDGETRGQWYVRQMLGSANLSGGPLLHVMTGNLSHQIEHHIFPDLPSNRYAEIAPRVREICERYGLRYTTGPLRKQYATVLRKINRYALPRRAERAALLAREAAQAAEAAEAARAVQQLPVRPAEAARPQPVRLAG